MKLRTAITASMALLTVSGLVTLLEQAYFGHSMWVQWSQDEASGEMSSLYAKELMFFVIYAAGDLGLVAGLLVFLWALRRRQD